MIVCSCNVLSEGQVRACLAQGADCPRTAAQVYQCLGCSPKCGRCARTIRSIVASAFGETHACSTTCATACPLAQTVERTHEPRPKHDHHHQHDHHHEHGVSVAGELVAV